MPSGSPGIPPRAMASPRRGQAAAGANEAATRSIPPPGTPGRAARPSAWVPTLYLTAWDALSLSCGCQPVKTQGRVALFVQPHALEPVEPLWQFHPPVMLDNYEPVGRYQMRIVQKFQHAQVFVPLVRRIEENKIRHQPPRR